MVDRTMKKRITRICGLSLVALVVTMGCLQSPPQEPPPKEVIATNAAPNAIGPYSQAIKVGDMLFCSGQIPINPETGDIVRGPIEAQTRQVLGNLGAVFTEAGMDYTDMVSVSVFIADMDNFNRINQIYAEYFMERPPARCAVEVSLLPKDVEIEISIIAVKTQ